MHEHVGLIGPELALDQVLSNANSPHPDGSAAALARHKPGDTGSGRHSPGLGLPREEGRGSFEQIAVLLEPLDLAPQLTELLPLSGAQPVVAFSQIKLSPWSDLTSGQIELL
jgi:hypothetical protein